ncbi:MAG: hypothetical protein D084_Lepto4C00437G0003 [Leptospirillum sp. Group IV 'UBA BS']|jgi:ribosomal protein L31E|nr:MAG: hypothetical protein D084_Lepto4C00437G0003 [Leptospirillum sp. Group IV 'UBA BS']
MSTIDSKEEKVSFHTDHNVYILGAGFSQEAGYPLISNFMEKMREATQWLEENHYETKELNTVLELRKDAAKAAYHVNFDPENIEDLFSLFAATDLAQNSLQSILVAILETLEYCRTTTQKKHLIFERSYSTTLPDGFEYENSEQKTNLKIDPFKFYVGLLLGKWGNTPYSSNTFISFNYDLLVEESLQKWNIPYRYHGLCGFDKLGEAIDPFYDAEFVFANPEDDQPEVNLAAWKEERNVVSILKLHGSVNWGTGIFSGRKAVNVFNKFSKLRFLMKHMSLDPLLAPPIWDKGIVRVGNPLSGVWSKAIEKLQLATRIIVIGYSLPCSDAHFRYLMAAGLRDNQSLKEIIFVNPALVDGNPSKEILEERIFSVFKKDQKILKLLPFETGEFFKNYGSVPVSCCNVLKREQSP